MLPYSLDVWFNTLARMNAELWPWAVMAWLIAVGVLAVATFPKYTRRPGLRGASRIAGAALGLGWIACGTVFFGIYLEPLFFGAVWLQLLYTAQGAALLLAALTLPMSVRRNTGLIGGVGRLIMVYAVLGIPLVDNWLGGELAVVRIVGLAPEATLVFTAGWLLTRQPHPALLALAVLPAGAAAFTGYSALALGWPVDWPAAGLGALPLAVFAAAAARKRVAWLP